MSSGRISSALLLVLSAIVAAPAAAQTRFDFSRWSTLAPASGWSVVSADVNSDPRTDVVAYYQGNRSVWTCPNIDGSRSFSCSLRTTLAFEIDYLRLVPTSFEQNATSMVSGVAFLSSQNSVRFECMLNPGSYCNINTGADVPAYSKAEAEEIPILNINYNGFGPPEYVVYAAGNLRAYTLFDEERPVTLASLSPASGWRFMSDDFDVDGKPDIMGYHAPSGTLRLCRNIKAVEPLPLGWRFNCAQTFTATGPAGFSLSNMTQVISGRFFKGSTIPGIMAYRESDGALFVGRRTGTSYDFKLWYNVAPATGWKWNVGYFSGRLFPQEVLGYYAGDGSLWVGTPK